LITYQLGLLQEISNFDGAFSFAKGWVVRIYLELTIDDVESWKVFNEVVDFKNRNYIDICNATQVIINRKLGDIFEMTWRWVYSNSLIIGLM
jgi:hypothetical protein